MAKNLLTKEEDLKFSKEIKDLNNISDEREFNKRYAKIRERASVLLYHVPKNYLLLDEELLSEVYLNCLLKLDIIIKNYEISRSSFNQYLIQCTRYQALNLIAKRRRKGEIDNIMTDLAKLDEENYIYIDEDPIENDAEKENTVKETSISDEGLVLSENSQTLSREDDQKEPSANREKESTAEIGQMAGKETEEIQKAEEETEPLTEREKFSLIYESITNAEINEPIEPDWEEEAFLRLLSDKTQIKYLLCFLLRLPTKNDDKFRRMLQRMLKVEKQVVDDFFNYKNEWVAEVNSSYKATKERANRNFIYLNRLKKAIELEEDAKRIKLLSENYRRVSRIRESQISRLREPRLSLKEISQRLGVSRSMISNAVKETLKRLQEISKEQV